MTRKLFFHLALAFALLAGCETGTPPMRVDSGPVDPFIDGGFVCVNAEVRACRLNVHYSCERDGEFLSPVIRDCAAEDLVCVAPLGCVICRPDEVFCVEGNVARCNGDGTDFDVEEECAIEDGFVCRSGRCENLCEIAEAERSYLGCEFFGADLDNAAIAVGQDASAQQYAIVVSNPSGLPTDVVVEVNRAAPGEPLDVEEIERRSVLPGDLEVFELPRREVDGSSSMFTCEASAACDVPESCYCAGGLVVEDEPPAGGHRDCRCRVRAGSNGLNDGTHSALTSRAYRVSSVLPVVAYQFNPLDNVGVFSNDASLLLPSSAFGQTYTVVGWPQTIADSDNPSEDFDPSRDDEDLRAFVTIMGSRPGTRVQVDFGPLVRRVVGLGDRPNAEPGDQWVFEDIGPFDVINIETWGFNADFTGTIVSADQPVGVFSGSEASDAPRFNTLSNRQCCADHLEEQIFSNDTLGRRFIIGRMPPRTAALNAAFLDPSRDSVGLFNEPEYVRIVAVQDRVTQVRTTLPPPDNLFDLEQGESVIITAMQDFEITADAPVAVLQVIASQEAVGIPFFYPGGDPATIAVPPVEQFRQEYVFLTPDAYAFDFIVLLAPRGAQIRFDGQPLPDHCETAPADGIRRLPDDPPPEWVIHRCQLSFPDVIGQPNVRVEDGIQNDGYHTLQANERIGLVVYGFDAFVSYAYAGGLNLDPLQ